MARRKSSLAGAAAAAGGARAPAAGWHAAEFWRLLAAPRRGGDRMSVQELAYLLRNLATLVDNGVSLPKALATLSREDSLARHGQMIDTIRRRVESGVLFSSALAEYPKIWDRLTINQIRVGEKSGTLAESLKQLAAKREQSSELRRQVIRKIAYPAMLVVFGSALIMFLLAYVLPVFQETYKSAGVPLPAITQALIQVSGILRTCLVPAALLAAVGVVALKQMRRHEAAAAKFDRLLLKAPLVGSWLRDISVLQMMNVLHNLMHSGFTLAEALKQTAESVGNRAVRSGVRDLQRAVQRGERFSRELERHEDIFPPIVNQLVNVAEQTGQLTRATADICEHLRREIERRTNLMVGTLEPVLTLGLSCAIALILLAIYLPMFDMVGAMK
jgi:type IV pilus assembly protein PilC